MYDYEFKKKVVNYFGGEGGYRYLVFQFGNSSHGVVRRWIKQVNAQGFDSLRKRKRHAGTLHFNAKQNEED